MKYKLSEIMDLIGGGTPKTSKAEYWDGDIPWLSVKDFNDDFRYVYKTEKHITSSDWKIHQQSCFNLEILLFQQEEPWESLRPFRFRWRSINHVMA